MVTSSQPRLVYCDSEQPHVVLGDYLLTKPTVTIGRASEDTADPVPDVPLSLRTVGRNHASIVRDNDGYKLTCYHHQGVQFYERTLAMNESIQFSELEYFSLPARRLAGDRHYKFCFTIYSKATIGNGKGEVIAEVEDAPFVRIGNHQPIKLTDFEYGIFMQLRKHRSCSYDQLIDSVWGSERAGKLADVEEALRQQLMNLRRKLRYRTASPPPAPPRRRKDAEQAGDEAEGEHCFLDIKWGEQVTLRTEDVNLALWKHVERHSPAQSI